VPQRTLTLNPKPQTRTPIPSIPKPASASKDTSCVGCTFAARFIGDISLTPHLNPHQRYPKPRQPKPARSGRRAKTCGSTGLAARTHARRCRSAISASSAPPARSTSHTLHPTPYNPTPYSLQPYSPSSAPPARSTSPAPIPTPPTQTPSHHTRAAEVQSVGLFQSQYGAQSINHTAIKYLIPELNI